MQVNFEMCISHYGDITKFCAPLKPKDTSYWLENLNIDVIEVFFFKHWYSS